MIMVAAPWLKRFPAVGLAVGFAGSVILFRKLIGVDTEQLLWADPFDGNLMVWTLEWGYHVIVELGSPRDFFQANSFYPHTNTLAYSDSFLSAQLLYSPLRALGVGQLPAIYLTLAGFCVLGCLLTDVALGRFGCFSRLERALIIFGAHFSLPMVCFFYHYQLFGFELGPPFLLLLFLYLNYWRHEDLATLCVVYFLGACFAMYLAPMFLVLVLATAPMPVWRLVRSRGLKRVLKDTVDARGIMIVLASMILFYLIQLRPYLEVARDFPSGSLEESVNYSARLPSLFSGFSIHSLWYSPGGYDEGGWERAYFPGYLLLLASGLYLGCGLCKVVQTWRKGGSNGSAVLGQFPYLSLASFMVITFLTAWIMSLGPFSADRYVRLPYWLVAKIVPGVDSIRAPGRFGMFVGLPMAIFVVGLTRHVTSRRWVGTLLTVLALIGVAVESLPNHSVYPFVIRHKEAYEAVAKVLQPGTPLLELPVALGDHYDGIRGIMNQLNGSTIHWARLVVGYGGKSSRESAELMAKDNHYKRSPEGPEKMIEFCRELRIENILVHLSDYPKETAEYWRRLIGMGGSLEAMTQVGDSILLRLRE